MIIGLQSWIWKNRLRTIYLLLSFPIVLFGVLFLVFFLMGMSDGHILEEAVLQARMMTWDVGIMIWPIILIWATISFFFHRWMIFKFSGAKPVTRVQEPDIYNIVENLCISKGLPTPQIGIIEDDSMNAFAVGWRPKNSWIVFSRGIINHLNKKEIEAVAAHELTHIINKDSLLMIIIVVFIGAVSMLGEILIRVGFYSRGGNNKDKGQVGLALGVVGLVLMLVGYIFFPLIRLAISRKREFLADAGSVELTKDRDAMISALQKISGDPVIESIKKDTVAQMCIANPFGVDAAKFSFKNLLKTHPPIEKRIEALRQI